MDADINRQFTPEGMPGADGKRSGSGKGMATTAKPSNREGSSNIKALQDCGELLLLCSPCSGSVSGKAFVGGQLGRRYLTI